MATLTLLPDTGHNHHSSQGPHHAKQKCTSTTCCSPSRLWKSIQQLIAAHDKQGLIQLCQDPTKSSHVLSVLLSSRLTNDASLYPASNKHRVLNLATLGEKTTPLYRAKVTTLFGKSATDLNALQLALFHRQEGIACYLLQLIRQHAPEKDRSLFVNHLWGARNGSLHLACFLDMPRVVQLLLDMGVSPDAVNGKLKTPLDCCNDHDSASALDCRTLVEQALLIKHGKKLSVDTSSPSPSAALVKPLPPPSPSDTEVSMVVDDDKTCDEKDNAGTTTTCPDPVLVDAPWSMQVHSYDALMADSGYLGTSVTYSPAGPLFKPKQDGLTFGSTPPLVDFVLPPFDLEEEDTDDDDDDGGMKYQDICWSPPLLPLDDPFPHYGHGDDDDLNLDVLSLPLVLDPLGISPVCGVPLEDDDPTSDLGASLDAGDTCQVFLEGDPCMYDAACDDAGDDDPGKQQDHSSQDQWLSLNPSPVFSKEDGDPSDGGDSSQRFDDDHDDGGGGDQDHIPLVDHWPAISLKSPDPMQDQSHSNGK
jgi:hypothetical protein